MIIYFDFSANKTRFIKQQNENKSFAVDFLIDKSQKRDFASIIEQICTQNDEILHNLKTEKNYVVIPDQVVGFDNLEVPTTQSFFSTKNKFFQTKFDLLYNQHNNMSVFENLYYKDKNKSIFTFAMTKTEIINQVINSFKKYNVLISGISYFSNVLGEYLTQKQKNFAKSNCLVVFNKKTVGLFAYSNGITLGTKLFENSKNKQILAKKYAKFAQNRHNLTKYLNDDFDLNVAKTKLDKQVETFETPKFEWAVDEFKNNFEKSNLNIKFNKVIVLNNSKSEQVEKENYFEINDFSVEDILLAYKKSPLYTAKRGFWL